MTTQQTLTILFKSRALEAYSNNERKIYINSLHPVVRRLGIDDKLDGKFVSLITHSEEYGEEQGVLSLTTLEMINILDTDDLIKKERESREQISSEEILQLSSTLEQLRSQIKIASENFSQFLEDQNYVLETTGGFEYTEYWAIHPLYHKEWLNDPNGEYPNWAVISR